MFSYHQVLSPSTDGGGIGPAADLRKTVEIDVYLGPYYSAGELTFSHWN